MDDPVRAHHMVVARSGRFRLAIPVHSLRKVVATPEVMPLPGAPAVVTGLINLHGTPLVVLDPARPAGEAPRQPALATSVAVVETERRSFGLLCEAVEGVVDMPETAWRSLDDLVPGVGYLAAGTAGAADLIVMRDPDQWLSAAQEHDLQLALDRHASAHAAPVVS